MKISILFFLFSLSLQNDYDQIFASLLIKYPYETKICLAKHLEEDRRKCIKGLTLNSLDTCFV